RAVAATAASQRRTSCRSSRVSFVGCPVHIFRPFEPDEMADPAGERPPGVRVPPGKHVSAASWAGVHAASEQKGNMESMGRGLAGGTDAVALDVARCHRDARSGAASPSGEHTV